MSGPYEIGCDICSYSYSVAYRCPDAGPLVLLDSEDIGNEVKDAFDQLHNVKRDDDKWARDLPSQLDRL